jgi:hypothetical protein
MPQQLIPPTFVFRDSLKQDTLWLDVNALPAQTYTHIDTPDLVFFHPDSAIAHLVRDGVDTLALHQMGLGDTALQKSFLHIDHPGGANGTPVTSALPRVQLILSASVLLILLAVFSVVFNTSKNRLSRYFLSLFNKRKFKEYFVEENPRLLPTLPIVYLLQSILIGSVVSVWLSTQMEFNTPGGLVVRTLAVMGGIALIPLLRNGLILTLGNVFMIQQEARKHIFISYLSHSLLFLLTIPLAIQLAIQVPFLNNYLNPALYTCFALTMGYQLFKLIQNTPLPDAGALLYIFLYFCTLEILPLFIIYKVVSIYA